MGILDNINIYGSGQVGNGNYVWGSANAGDLFRMGRSLLTGEDGDGSLGRGHPITKLADAMRDFHFERGEGGRRGEVQDFLNIANGAGGLDARIEVPYEVRQRWCQDGRLPIYIQSQDGLFGGSGDVVQVVHVPIAADGTVSPRDIANAMAIPMGGADRFNAIAAELGTANVVTGAPVVQRASYSPEGQRREPEPVRIPGYNRDVMNAETITLTANLQFPAGEAYDTIGERLNAILTTGTINGPDGQAVGPDGRAGILMSNIAGYINEPELDEATRAARTAEVAGLLQQMNGNEGLRHNLGVSLAHVRDEQIAALADPALQASLRDTRDALIADLQDGSVSRDGGGMNIFTLLLGLIARYLPPEMRTQLGEALGIDLDELAADRGESQAADGPEAVGPEADGPGAELDGAEDDSVGDDVIAFSAERTAFLRSIDPDSYTAILAQINGVEEAETALITGYEVLAARLEPEQREGLAQDGQMSEREREIFGSNEFKALLRENGIDEGALNLNPAEADLSEGARTQHIADLTYGQEAERTMV